MAPLVLEGDTLGQKHRNYNKIVKETTQEQIPEINYDEPDLDNLLKIDIACKNRNVDYIIKVLQCEDMLYVSRAIKRSTWLITEEQYSNIIDPKYLNDQLSPNMMTKAFNKLLLHIRLNLTDEKRVDEFFNYYKEQDLKLALKWLPSASIELIEKIVQKHADEIPTHLIKRLCEKSITCLDIYMRSSVSYYKRDTLAATLFLLKVNMEKYLNIIEAAESYVVPSFGPKATKLIMNICSERIMKNLDKYSSSIHVPTFAKFIKRENIKDFITTNIKNKNLLSWFTHNKIKPFVNLLPIESRFEFIKEVFVNKKQEDDVDNEDIIEDCCDAARGVESNSQNIYSWYAYAPFYTAFVDLKKLIRSESNPSERTSMFGVMLTCAGKNMKNIHTLLKYYRENHINEPFKFKVQFVNLVISYTNTHKFNKETWGYLNDLFSSMDVYSKSDKLDQNCVRSIILYNVIQGESIPDIIEKKFLFDTFKTNQKKLTEEEKENLFLYLYKYLMFKINARKITDKKEFTETIEELTNVLNLLVDWNKELQDFPIILDKIKESIQINQKNKWNEDISVLYNVKKSWRKLLFAESIVLSPTQEVCINVLKHGPELLENYKAEVESLCLNENKQIDRFLQKVRIYWSESLANYFKVFFQNKINQKNNHKASIIGLCTLFDKKDLSNLVQKYVPIESKIDWSRSDDLDLNLRKHIASNLHLARPQLSPDVVLLYAKGDYLQFVLPSLNSILYNMSSVATRQHLTRLLDTPVSLQKHGIRIAFAKLKHDELKKLFSHIWETNKNSSIRETIFNQTLDFLCKQNDQLVIREVWELLSMFMDNLTSEENKSIYTNLSKAEKVPMSVRPEFWMKSYKLLKSLPPNASCDGLLNHLRYKMDEVMEFLDDDFVARIFLESFVENYSTKLYEFQYLVVEFVLTTKTEEAHMARYNKILVPILEQSFAMWNKSHEGTNYVRENFTKILMLLDMLFDAVVLQKNMLLPIPMFTDILKRLRENLSIEENYVIITTRKLSLDCVLIFDKVLKSNETLASAILESIDDKSDKFKPLYAETAVELGKLCVNYLKEDVSNYFPSIYRLFAKAFKNITENINFNLMNKMNALKAFLEYKEFIPGYLFVLKALPDYTYEEDEKSLKTELLNVISTHSSEEIKLHYNSHI